MLFWAVRLIAGFATVALLMFSWRASMTVATCLFFDFFGTIVAGMPGAGLWNHARMMLGVGLVLGAVTAIGRRGGNVWDHALLALPVCIVLSASWLDASAAETLASAWPAYVASAVALPAGCGITAAAVDAGRRALKNLEAKRSR